MLFDAATEGRNVIVSMLVVGLIFLGTSLLGELVHWAGGVDPHLEITESVDRTVKAGGPALLFERPRGAKHPLLINQFGTERRMCMAFGVERLDDVGAKLANVLEMQPPEGLAN